MEKSDSSKNGKLPTVTISTNTTSTSTTRSSLRRLQFVGIDEEQNVKKSHSVECTSTTVQLDEECAKIFAVDSDISSTDQTKLVASFHEKSCSPKDCSKQHGEKEENITATKSTAKRRFTAPSVVPDNVAVSPRTESSDESVFSDSALTSNTIILAGPSTSTADRKSVTFSPPKRRHSAGQQPPQDDAVNSQKLGGILQRLCPEEAASEEDFLLHSSVDADCDQLDSHRLRRQRTSRSSSSPPPDGDASRKEYDHSPHAIFVELDELHETREAEGAEWRETARWIKYEEDVDEDVDKWGKPHVAPLSFHSLLNLRKCLEDGVVILDLEQKNLPSIAYEISEHLWRAELIRKEDRAEIVRTLMLRHHHVDHPHHHHQHHHHHYGGGFLFSKRRTYASLQNLPEGEQQISENISAPASTSTTVVDVHRAMNEEEEPEEEPIIRPIQAPFTVEDDEYNDASSSSILRCIPPDAQSSSIQVGTVDFLVQPAIAFVRLAEAVRIPALTEINLPIRFIFVLLGPPQLRTVIEYHEVGRAMATLMANQQFDRIAYTANDRRRLLSAINEFLDESIVLPPGIDFERASLLPLQELKEKSEALRRRRQKSHLLPTASGGDRAAGEPDAIPLLDMENVTEDGTLQQDFQPQQQQAPRPPPPPPSPPPGPLNRFSGGRNPLVRTYRLWGGLIDDVKSRYPLFKSDILDGFKLQCIAAAFFVYFAALTGAITFGGLLADKTGNLIGISETLVATCGCGIVFALLSGQPLVIIGSTGPLLLFDESLFEFSKKNNLEFLTFRVYIGIWLAVIGLLVACFEGSVLVKRFTRFTEDIFSAVIVLLYIVESVSRLVVIYQRHPILSDYCAAPTNSSSNATINVNSTTAVERHDNSSDGGGGGDVLEKHNQPNTALFCTILALGTFTIAYYLKLFRNSLFLGRNVRRAIGDFGVPIAIVAMVLIDFLVHVIYTEKLNVPVGFSPTNKTQRAWLISPSGRDQPFPVYLAFASIIPALLVYILLFMETHIAELIIDKKERKLKKGSGFHLDIVLLCLLNVLSGFFGLPWVCAATVRSIAHVSALSVLSTTYAPGEMPHLVQVREQRCSALLVAVAVGLSVLAAPLLRHVPLAVLFGVFLYMGVASMDGIQFIGRIKLFFMPIKHYPRTTYNRKVKTRKIHYFTAIQIACVAVLWGVKSTSISLAFPFFLILMVPLRTLLQKMYNEAELMALDGDQQEDAEEDEPDFYAEALLPC